MIDTVFLSWIYLALNSTIRVLKEVQQTYKVSVYNQLYNVILAFLILFSLVTLLIGLSQFDVITWPWQLEWIPLVLWTTLNFVILTCVCSICVPSDHSRMLSYASQIPQFDPGMCVYMYVYVYRVCM